MKIGDLDKYLDLIKENNDLIDMLVDKHKSTLYRLITKLFSFYADYANNEDYFATKAKVFGNFYRALIAEGFTPEQAMNIIIASYKSVGGFINELSAKLNNVPAGSVGK